MMERQEIEISILPDGRIEYTIQGVKGSRCEEISALLEELGQVEDQERTGEYYEREDEIHITADSG